jgi:hypothetical protein
MRWRFRYSLRWLLLAFVPVGLVLQWALLPTLQAQRFAAAVNAGAYPAAERLCLDRQRAFPGHWAEHKTFEPRAHLSPLTWEDAYRGQRRLIVAISYGDGHGIAMCCQECTATARGIEIGMAIP